MIINIFSEYVVSLLKDINHPELLQEQKLNIDTTEYERNIDANMSKPSEKMDRHNRDLYRPTTI